MAETNRWAVVTVPGKEQHSTHATVADAWVVARRLNMRKTGKTYTVREV